MQHKTNTKKEKSLEIEKKNRAVRRKIALGWVDKVACELTFVVETEKSIERPIGMAIRKELKL